MLLVERDPRRLSSAGATPTTSGLAVEVVAIRSRRCSRSPRLSRFDIVFADPPYELATATVSAQMRAARRATAGSTGRADRGRAIPPDAAAGLAGCRLRDLERAYGETIVYFAALEEKPGEPGRWTMTRAVCPGSFDPVTHGHLDVIGRTARLVDEVVVAVGNNMAKNALFTPQERVAMLAEECAEWPTSR